MTIAEMIPTLNDDEVFNLLANAQRLAADGEGRQQAAAADLLPALEQAAGERRDARLAAAQAKRMAARAPKTAAA